MGKPTAILLLCSLLFCCLLQAQEMERFNSFSYNVNEGLLQSHANNLAVDKNNFGWLSFANGIQKFDGNSFINVPIQKGLPDDKSVLFFTTLKGELLVSHSQGISRYELSNNTFVTIWQNNSLQPVPAAFLGEDENTIYFFTAAGNIEGIDADTYEQHSITKTNFKKFISSQIILVRPSTNIVGHKIALYIDSTLVLWDLKDKKIVGSTKPLNINTYFQLWLITQTQVAYMSVKKDNDLIAFDFNTNKGRGLSTFERDPAKPLRGKIFKWKNKYFISYYNHLYETDSSLTPLKKLL